MFFKVELLRYHLAIENERNVLFYTVQLSSNNTVVVKEKKYEKPLAAGQKDEREISFTLPDTDLCKGDKYELSSAQKVTHKDLSCSIEGKLLKVQYYLKVYVRHNAWNSFFDGKSVTIPIKLVKPFVPVANEFLVQQPVGWNP